MVYVTIIIRRNPQNPILIIMGFGGASLFGGQGFSFCLVWVCFSVSWFIGSRV